LCRVVIVAFSAFGDGGNRERALAAGCDDYVSKAEGVTRLHDILTRHLPHG
jgi:CheY-like chemotaxis protein